MQEAYIFKTIGSSPISSTNITNNTNYMSIIETFFLPLKEPEMNKPNNTEVTNSCIKYLNSLEGFKTKIKNLHWSAENINIHVKLDELLEAVSDIQDSVAEEYMGIMGKLSNNILVPVNCDVTDPLVLLTNIKSKTTSFYISIKNEEDYIGMRSELETFSHTINKFIYLFKLCK